MLADSWRGVHRYFSIDHVETWRLDSGAMDISAMDIGACIGPRESRRINGERIVNLEMCIKNLKGRDL